VDFVVGRDVSRPVFLQVTHELGGCQVQVIAHHFFHLGERPVLGICPVQKGRDVIRVGGPALDSFIFFRRIAFLGGIDDVHGDEDVVLQ